jgi:pimeloyl-ACP methyl ester carboxylesterase
MLSYQVEGHGPPLLLIHGWGVTYNIWEALAPRLADHFQLIMIEMPGLGGSAPARPGQGYFDACVAGIEAVREALGLDAWSVLAHSVGTRVAEAYLRQAASKVNGVVLLCPLTVAPIQWTTFRALRRLNRRWPAFGDWLLSGWRLHNLVIHLAFNGRRHRYAASWEREISRYPRESILQIQNDLPDSTSRPVVPAGLPTLAIWARQDRVVAPPRRPLRCDRLIDADHSAPLLAAPAVSEAVLAFFGQGPAADQVDTSAG